MHRRSAHSLKSRAKTVPVLAGLLLALVAGSGALPAQDGTTITFEDPVQVTPPYGGFNGQTNSFMISQDGKFRVEGFYLYPGPGSLSLYPAKDNPSNLLYFSWNASSMFSLRGIRITQVDGNPFTLDSMKCGGWVAIGQLTDYARRTGDFTLFSGTGEWMDPQTITFGTQFENVTEIYLADPSAAGVPGTRYSWWDDVVLRESGVEVDLDVKPGEVPNAVNLAGNGFLPVAVLSTPEFDATFLDLHTAVLGDPLLGQWVSPARSQFSDADNDQDLDAVFFFKLTDLVAAGAINEGSEQLFFSGKTLDDKDAFGSDWIRIVGQGLSFGEGARMSLTDLGTLGGPYSYAYAISDAGHVIGYSRTASNQNHPFLWTPEGGMVDLGTLGGSYGYAYGVNNSGHVTGYIRTATNQSHAFFWAPEGGMVDLGTLGGTYSYPGSYVYGGPMSNSDQVAGYSRTATNETHAFVWTPQSGMVDLGTLGGATSGAYVVNDAGQVAGYSGTAINESHAFLWTALEGMKDLGTLGGKYCYARAINGAGHVAGYSRTTDSYPYQYSAFLWTPQEGMKDLGNLGGTSTYVTDMSNSGQVVGYGSTAGGQTHAFLWSARTGMVDLGTLGGTSSYAYAVNNRGWVVGQSTNPAGQSRAFLWTVESGMIDLGTLGGSSSYAYDINEAGKIVGYAATADNNNHAVLWEVPGGATQP